MKKRNKIILPIVLASSILLAGSNLIYANDRGADFELNHDLQTQVIDKRAINLQKEKSGNDSSYDLRKHVDIELINQGSAGTCWAFSATTMFESTLQKTRQDRFKMSTMHLIYGTSSNFQYDAMHEFGLNKDGFNDGSPDEPVMGYLTNGMGPISRSKLEYSHDYNRYNLEAFKNLGTSERKTEEWRRVGYAYKEYDSSTGNAECYNIIDEETYLKMDNTQVQSMRNNIKNHLQNYGAVTSTIVLDGPRNNDAVYYHGNTVDQPHAVTIIGWDDNYSIEHFNAESRPKSNGAYLVQNSKGNDKSYFYVSYEDKWVEAYCFGIEKIRDVNYDKIYQHDAQGENYTNLFKDNTNEFWVASVFTREDVKEYLTEVAVTTLYDCNFELYINPVDESLNGGNVQKISFSEMKVNDKKGNPITPSQNYQFVPGYHTIMLDQPLKLTGNKFAVILKYTKISGKSFGVTYLSSKTKSRIGVNGELTYETATYENVNKIPGACFYGTTQATLADLTQISSDATYRTCIKAFTKRIKEKDKKETSKIKDQGNADDCWSLPMSIILESNMMLKNYQKEEFSTRHMDYATSQSFKNGAKNKYGYERKAGTEGTAEWGMAYLTNGMGAISEISMPRENQYGDIDISEIMNKTPIAKVTDWVQLPEINKEKTSNGIKYTKKDGTEYTASELENLRDKIKLHLLQNGALYTETFIDGYPIYYNKQTGAYYCDDSTQKVDHGVAIIGWDDTYSKNNFNTGHKPSTDGAYIVQNSWGEEGEVAPLFYISYEDPNVERRLYGIENVVEKDNTETIYQYDELGRNTSIAISGDEVFGANIFTRENPNVNETLKEVSISVYNDTNYEVYVNPNGGDLNSTDLQLVAKSDNPVENGYHTIKFDEPINLTGSKFAVAIRYMGTDENLVTMQAKKSGAYSNITGNPGESYIGISLDGMTDITTISEIPEGSLCIKAFTNKEGQKYSVLRGDANLDGQLTAFDLVLMQNHLVGLYYLQGYAFETVDFNEDGELTAADLAKEMMLIAGLNI